VSAMERGGAETLIMNIYRNLDRSKIQFDFVTHRTAKGDFEDEILSLGGKIFRIPSLGEDGPLKYIRNLVTIMSRESYEAIHSHTDFQSGFPALAAKICGIKNRICHSHSNNWPQGRGTKATVTLKILQTIIRFSATKYCSCSMEAAEFLFGKKLVEKSKVNILRNGIDLSQFLNVDPSSREGVIKELHLNGDVKMIGHVGRFSESKNHFFILKVLQKLVVEDPYVIALLVGDGPLRDQVEIEAKRLGIMKNVRFLGVRDDIPKLMKAFDVFIFPSTFEGFGIVAIEAQSAGTPCVTSDAVPKTTDMGVNLITYVSLDEDLNMWTEQIKKAFEIKKLRTQCIDDKILASGFDIRGIVPKWLSLYGLKNSALL
jgi:glycosyltransferase EpsF